MAAGTRRIYPQQRELAQAEESRISELETLYNLMCEKADDELAASLQNTLMDIDREIESIRGEAVYSSADKSIAGAFVSLGTDGRPCIEHGVHPPHGRHQKGGQRAQDFFRLEGAQAPFHGI